ncbi:hypothetical protein LWI28_020249 [Acer negundo]|uniref:Uncharacterized protein n=1 Tax=Acer negundo TaxID=4023 RepID=A0AAD5JG25_ACENE|nr:hypothetical protein LWI28_020249 [Acer negundo]
MAADAAQMETKQRMQKKLKVIGQKFNATLQPWHQSMQQLYTHIPGLVLPPFTPLSIEDDDKEDKEDDFDISFSTVPSSVPIANTGVPTTPSSVFATVRAALVKRLTHLRFVSFTQTVGHDAEQRSLVREDTVVTASAVSAQTEQDTTCASAVGAQSQQDTAGTLIISA